MGTSQSADATEVPEIQPFQMDGRGNGSLFNSVNLFRGDANFNAQLIALPGRNGLDVNISAIYQSNVHREATRWNRDEPTGILGLGWDMPFDRVEADSNGTSTADDNVYYLVYRGARNRLYRTSRRWKRGSLPSSFAGTLDAGAMDGPLQAALLAQGLQIDRSAAVTTVRSGLEWQITDSVSETLWDVSQGTDGQLVVEDGGAAYELQSFDYSRIGYYPTFERWQVTYANGMVKSFGGGVQVGNDGVRTATGNTIQWRVVWDNWQGPSALTHDPNGQRLQSQVAGIWNLAQSQTVWGDTTTFRYDAVLQAVGNGGLPYTKACYLVSITEVFGRSVEFIYSAKAFDTSSPGASREYFDPNKPVPDNQPDAFQSSYQDQYLSALRLIGEEGDLIFTISFQYDLQLFSSLDPNTAPSIAGDSMKRVLVGVVKQLANGAALPALVFSYYGASDTHPGAMRSITFPEGGTVTYTYQLKQLPNCARDLRIDAPLPGATPRVWFGPTYALVLWYHPSGQLSVALYTWLGMWRRWLPAAPVTQTYLDLDDISVTTEDEFCVVHFAHPSGQGAEVRVYHQDPNVLGGWIEPPAGPIILHTAKRQVASGARFFAVNDQTNHTITRYVWDGPSQSWQSSALDDVCDPAVGRRQYFIAGATNTMLTLCYDLESAPGTKRSRIRLDFLDELGAWQVGDTIDAPDLAIAGPQPEQNFGWTHAGWMAAACYIPDDAPQKYTVALYRWFALGANAYQFAKAVPSFTYDWPKSQPSGNPVFDFIAQSRAGGLIATGPNLLRYNGADWLQNDNLALALPPADDTPVWFAYGDDVVLETESGTQAVIGSAQAFDPNTNITTWNTPAIPLFQGSPGDGQRLRRYFPTVGTDFVSWNDNLFYRGTSTDWVHPLQSPLSPQLPPNVDTTSIVNEGPMFVSYLRRIDSQPPVAEVAVFWQGAVAQTIQLEGAFFSLVGSDGHYVSNVNGMMPGGAAAFVTYMPADKDFDAATSIRLHRFVGDTLNDPLSHYPVATVTLDDGFDTVTYRYQFDEQTAIFDPSGQVAKFFTTTVTPGADDNGQLFGYTLHRFINGLGGTDPAGNPSGPAALDGLPGEQIHYDSAGKEVVRIESEWSVSSVVSNQPDDSASEPIHGVYVHMLSRTAVRDGVSNTVAYGYGLASGQVNSQQTTNYDGIGRPQTIVKDVTYGYAVYSQQWAMNRLSAPVLACTTVIASDGSAQVTDATSETFLTFPRAVAGGTVAVLDNFQSLRWLGPGTPSVFVPMAANIEPPPEWFEVSRICARTGCGLVLEREAPIGFPDSLLYDRLQGMLVSSFSDARIGESFYYGFEAYEDPQGWLLDASETPIVGDVANTGACSLRVPPGTSSAALALGRLDASKSYLLSFWARATAEGARALVTPDNGPPVIVVVPATGSWTYCFQRIVPTSGGRLSIVFQNNGTADVHLDDVAVATFCSQFVATVYEPPTFLVTATVGPFEHVVRRFYDGYKRQVGQTDLAQNLIRYDCPFLSRQSDGTWNAATPNMQVSAQPMGTNYCDTFFDGGAWQDHWDSPDPAQWQSGGGSLRHIGTSPGAVVLRTPALMGDYFAALVLALPQNVANPLGFTIGGSTRLEWQPATGSWTLSGPNLGPMQSPVTSTSPGNSWWLALTPAALLFLVDGRVVFSLQGMAMPSGAVGIFATDPVAITHFVIGSQPQIGAKFFDGGSKPRQGHSIENAASVITAVLYDALGRPSVHTKPAAVATTTASPLLSYRASFVSAFDPVSGVMTGDVADAYPDDKGYPYGRQLREASPPGRIVETGLPGKDFAIVDLDKTTPAQRHTTKLAYGANAAGAFPAGLVLPPGCYFQTNQTDADGIVTMKCTDQLGNIVAQGARAGTKDTFVQSTYDVAYVAAGQVHTEHLPNAYDPPASSTSANWVRVRSYDRLNRMISRVEPDGAETTIVYSRDGHARFSQDAADRAVGQILYNKYDRTGRMTEAGVFPGTWDGALLAQMADVETWPGPEQGPMPRSSRTYDGDGTILNRMGNLVTVTVYESGTQRPALTTSFDYDAAMRLQALTTCYATGEIFTTTLTYDNLGNRLSIVYPSGYRLDYVRDCVGRITAIRDAAGATLGTWQYDPADRIVGETLRPGTSSEVSTGFSFNPPGWIEAIDSTLLTERLSYTSGGYQSAGYYNGRIASQSVTLCVPPAAGFVPTLLFRLAYDDLGRLAVAQASDGETPLPALSLGLPTPITYDANGNFLTVPTGSGTQKYSYQPGTDRVVNTTGGTEQAFAYDAGGAVTAAAPRGISHIDYDAAIRRPVAIETAGHGTLTLQYDHRGNRVAKKTAAERTLYIRGDSGWPLAEVTDSAPGQTTNYLYGPAGLFGIERNGQLLGVLRDHLKSSRLLVGDAGAVVSGFQYLPFGGLAEPAFGDREALRYLFTGFELDPETGLYNAGARLYDPALRRFYSVDPRLQFASPYLYAGNDPFAAIDPTGEAAWWAVLIGFIFGGIITVVTAGVGAAFLGGDLAFSIGIGAVSGVAGSVAGDATTAGVSGEPFTGQRALLDVVTGAVGGAVGAGVGGLASRAAMKGAFEATLAAKMTEQAAVSEVSRVGTVAAFAAGGIAGATAASGVASAMTGQQFFSSATALNIALGGAAGFLGASTADVYRGWLGMMPVAIGREDLLHIKYKVTPFTTRTGETRRLFTAVSKGEYNLIKWAMLAGYRKQDAVFRLRPNGPPEADVVAAHSNGRVAFVWTGSGYYRPIPFDLLAYILKGEGFDAASADPNSPVAPLKLVMCLAGLLGRFSGAATFSDMLGRTSVARSWFVWPTEANAQNWGWATYHP
jgi:large repetitive protein